jgi:hypothetical protein
MDEFQSVTTLSFVTMSAEWRKHAAVWFSPTNTLRSLNLRYDTSLGHARTLMSFRVRAEDASRIAKEMQPRFAVEDLINLPNHHIYLKP